MAVLIYMARWVIDNQDISISINKLGLDGSSGILQIGFVSLISIIGFLILVVMGNIIALIILNNYKFVRKGAVLLVSQDKIQREPLSISFSDLEYVELEKRDGFMRLYFIFKDDSSMIFVIALPFYISQTLIPKRVRCIED